MKRTPLRKYRKGTKAAQKRQCDALWAKLIKLKHPFCLCGEPSTDAHHIYGRASSPHLRHEPLNGVGLCRACHDEEGNRPWVLGFMQESKKAWLWGIESINGKTHFKPDYAEICTRLQGMIDELLQRD